VVEADDLSPNGWSGCWLFTGADNGRGYGQVRTGNGLVQTHVAIYELVIGKVPPGMHLHHHCERSRCCNPAHLEPLTPREHRAQHALVGWAAENVTKTHCKHGHSLSGANLRVERNGSRRCRACWYETRR